MKVKRKNGSNRYVIKVLSSFGLISMIILCVLVILFEIITIIEDFNFMEFYEKLLYLLVVLSALFFLIISIYFYLRPMLIIDFNNGTIKMKKQVFSLKDIVKIEYIKKKIGYYDEIIVYMNNDTFNFDFINGHGVNLQKAFGYPMARKIEEINNKLQEYRKQNNLD